MKPQSTSGFNSIAYVLYDGRPAVWFQRRSNNNNPPASLCSDFLHPNFLHPATFLLVRSKTKVPQTTNKTEQKPSNAQVVVDGFPRRLKHSLVTTVVAVVIRRRALSA